MMTLDKILKDKELHDIHELEANGGIELDDDDKDEIMCEALDLLEELVLRPQPKYLQVKLLSLKERLKNVLAWYTLQ